MRDLPCRRIRCDEIWSVVYAKEMNVTRAIAEKKVAGSVWTWTAIDADSKLIPCWLIGKRDAGCATEFMQDPAVRLIHRVQITSDGLKVYLNAVMDSFGNEVELRDFTQGVRFRSARRGPLQPRCLHRLRKKPMIGNPDEKHVRRLTLSVRTYP